MAPIERHSTIDLELPLASSIKRGFNPTLLNYLNVLHGNPSILLDQEYAYCELGCGDGKTTSLLAASNPMGSFYGIEFRSAALDVVPSSFQTIEALCRQSALSNLTFIECSIAELLESPLPQFQFITLHVPYSQLSPEDRKALLDVIQIKLCPGGIFAMGYHAMPGWSAWLPLCEMIRAYTHSQNLHALGKTQEGVKYLRFLCDHESEYFQKHPSARNILEVWERSDLQELSQICFDPHWEPLYFTEVATSLEQAGLTYVGSLPIYLNYSEICVPEGLQSLFKTAPDRSTLEIHKDFVRNTAYRRDLYFKPHPDTLTSSSEVGKAQEMAIQAFGAVLLQENTSLERSIPLGRYVVLNDPIYEPLLNQLTTQAATLETLCQLPSFDQVSQEDLLAALHYLIMLEQALPFAQVAPDMKSSYTEHPKIVLPFNRLLLEQEVFQNDSLEVASPVYGAGLTLGFGEALMLLAIDHAGFTGAVDYALNQIESHGVTIQSNQEQPSLDSVPPRTLLENQCVKFQENLRYWLHLKILHEEN